LDGYNSSDITAFKSSFALSTFPTLENVLVDGYSGAAGGGADEVTLDIELAGAIAPGMTKILVYEGPNSDAGVLDTYSRIASDNRASQVSTSWGLSEDLSGTSVINAEATFFQEMAANGQSVFAASGDNGAFDNQYRYGTLEVDDPGSQPHVTSVGGTTL